MYALFSYDRMLDGAQWSALWYRGDTLVYVRGKGLICSEPSVVAVVKEANGRDEKVLAVGHEAKEMLGRTPGGIRAIRPIKDPRPSWFRRG